MIHHFLWIQVFKVYIFTVMVHSIKIQLEICWNGWLVSESSEFLFLLLWWEMRLATGIMFGLRVGFIWIESMFRGVYFQIWCVALRLGLLSCSLLPTCTMLPLIREWISKIVRCLRKVCAIERKLKKRSDENRRLMIENDRVEKNVETILQNLQPSPL